MKLINKHNFFPVVCVLFTVIMLVKVIFEAVTQGLFENYQENIITIFLLSLLATFVLSLHYRFRRLPLILVIIVQYLFLVGVALAIVWASSFYEPLNENAYRDMFLSFTIVYAVGAVVYYISFFMGIRRANKTLSEIKAYQNEKNKNLKGEKDNEKDVE